MRFYTPIPPFQRSLVNYCVWCALRGYNPF